MPYDTPEKPTPSDFLLHSRQAVDRLVGRLNALIQTQEGALVEMREAAKESGSAARAAWIAAIASAVAAFANVAMALLMWWKP